MPYCSCFYRCCCPRRFQRMKRLNTKGRKWQELRLFDRAFNMAQTRNEHKGFPSNYVRTTKYRCITFPFLGLLNQFKRIANIYFLVIMILQSIPDISPLNPISAIAPFVFVISVSMTREGCEDCKRYRADKSKPSSH